MKKNYKLILGVAFSILLSLNSFSQVINEGFDDISTLPANGWAEQNLSTAIGTAQFWFQGSSAVFIANSGQDTAYIGSNFNSLAGTGDISNWLFAPNRTFDNGDVITFYTRSTGGTYADNLQVRLSTNGASLDAGTTASSVGDFTTLLLEVNPTLVAANYPATWTQFSITISGLAGPTSGRVAFRYFVTDGGPSGSNSDFIGIDDFVYVPFGSALPDVTVSNPSAEYTIIPLDQVVSTTLQADINNIGTASTSDATLTTRVFLAPDYTTPVQTTTSTPTTVAASSNVTLTAGSFNPNTIGTYRYQYISSCTNNTITTLDTINVDFNVVDNMYARDNGITVGGIGVGNTASGIVGSTFQINATTNMDSVLFFCAPGTAGLGDTIRLRIASTTAGVPNNTGYVGQSAPYKYTVSDTTANGALLVLPITNMTGGRLNLAPGNYFVGVEEYITSDNMSLQVSSSIFTENTVYANINNGAYATLNSLLAGYNNTPIIRPFLNTCVPVTNTIAANVCNNGSYTYADGTVSNNIVADESHVSTLVGASSTSCDSILTENITVLAIKTGTDNTTICATGSVVINGTTYDAATPTGTEVFTNIGPNNCDSTVTVALNVLPALTGTDNTTICATGSVVINGTTYDAATPNGTEVFTNVGPNNCDSTVTVALNVLPALTGTDNTTICATGSVVINGTTYDAATPNGTEVFTNVGPNNCDSTVTVALNVLPALTGTDNTTICATGSVVINGTTYDAATPNGTEVFTNVGPNNCDSTVTVALNVETAIDVTIDNTLMPTLTANQAGATYQWVDCDNGNSPIATATGQSFTATANGNYAVEITVGSCTDLSGCESVTGVGINEPISKLNINIYPNPTTGVFTVNVAQINPKATITVYSVIGQVIMHTQVLNNKTNIDLSIQDKGVYFVKIQNGEEVVIERIIKQ
jgi:hypothetical protein